MGNSRFPLNWKVHSTSGKPLKSAVESKREDTIGTLEEESRNCDDRSEYKTCPPPPHRQTQQPTKYLNLQKSQQNPRSLPSEEIEQIVNHLEKN